MSDLASLMGIAPTTAAGFMGINQRQAEQMQVLKQRELADLMMQRQMEAEQKSAMHPLELEGKRLANQTASAQLPGLAATSRKLGYEADLKGATLGSEIDSKNTTNAMASFRTIGENLAPLADEIEASGVPPQAAFVDAVSRLNLPEKVKQSVLQRYGQGDPSKLVERLRSDSARILRSTPAYAQTMDQTALQGKNRLAEQELQNRGQMAIEDKRIAAGKYESKKKQDTVQGIMDATVNKALQKGARAGHAALVAASEWATRNQLPELSARYEAMAERIRPQAEAEIAQSQPPAGGIDVGNMTGLPTNPPRSIAPPPRGDAPKPTSANGRVSVVSPDGKRGSIPESQLQDALKQGYKKVQ